MSKVTTTHVVLRESFMVLHVVGQRADIREFIYGDNYEYVLDFDTVGTNGIERVTFTKDEVYMIGREHDVEVPEKAVELPIGELAASGPINETLDVRL